VHEVVHLHRHTHSIEAHGHDVLGGGAVVTRAHVRLERILQGRQTGQDTEPRQRRTAGKRLSRAVGVRCTSGVRWPAEPQPDARGLGDCCSYQCRLLQWVQRGPQGGTAIRHTAKSDMPPCRPTHLSWCCNTGIIRGNIPSFCLQKRKTLPNAAFVAQLRHVQHCRISGWLAGCGPPSHPPTCRSPLL